MESRLEIIKQSFEKEHKLFLNTFSLEIENEKEDSKKVSVSKSKKKSEKSPKINEDLNQESKEEPKIKTPKTPILLNKINKHKYDLDKNNMKRKQTTVECTGILGDDLDINDIFFKSKDIDTKENKTIKNLE